MDTTLQLDPTRITFFDTNTTKKEALNELVDLSEHNAAVKDVEALRNAIFDREKTLSTGIGLGIAVPHAKIAEVEQFLITVGISTDGIAFDALDGKPVHIVALIAGPEGAQDEYLKILAHLTLFLKNKNNRKAILNASSTTEVAELLKKADQTNDG